MPPADEEEKAHRAKLQREYTRRKRLLEIRKARQGDRSDPALDIELDEVNASLALLDFAEQPKPTPEVRAAVPHDHILDLVVAQLGKLNERQTISEERDVRIEERVKNVEEHQQAAAEWREETSKKLEQEHVDRVSGQRRNFRLLVAAVVLAALVFGTVVGIDMTSSGIIIIIAAAVAAILIGLIIWGVDRLNRRRP